MSNRNEELKEFWNNCFSFDGNVEAINSKWIEDETFNKAITDYANKNSNVLDYGSGSGWGLIEIYHTIHNKFGLGIDPSENGVRYSNEVLKASNIENLKFVCGTEVLLNQYKEYFDFAISINTLDVVEDEIVESILSHIKSSLKKDCYFVVCINPRFTEDQLVNLLKMNRVGNYWFKDGILRSNEKTPSEWENLFNKYFEFIEYKTFALQEREKNMPRQMFILKNSR